MDYDVSVQDYVGKGCISSVDSDFLAQDCTSEELHFVGGLYRHFGSVCFINVCGIVFLGPIMISWLRILQVRYCTSCRDHDILA